MPPRYSQQFLDELISKVDIVDLVGQYVHLTPKGTNYWGLCPFHGEKTPSFSVAPHKNIFYCFGCQKGGGPLQFLMELEGLGFQEALQILSQKAGLSLPDQESTPQDKQKDALLELNKKLSQTFRYLLKESEEGDIARQVLLKRGVPSEIQEKFHLGYAPQDRNWAHKFLLSKNYKRDFLKESGLFSRKYESIFLFSGRLIFPILNHKQEVVAFGGRALLPDQEPKYLNSPETSVYHKGGQLYGIHLALPSLRQLKQVWLCEGYMDVIALHSAGITNAVAPLGTAFTQDQAQFLKKYINSIVLLFDSDHAGLQATIKSLRTAEEAQMEAFVLTLGGAKDPAEILEREGPESLKNLLKNPVNGFDFLLNYLYNAYYQKSIPDVEGFLKGLFEYLESVKSEVKRESYLNLTAQKLNVSRSALVKDASKRLTPRPIQSTVKPRPTVRAFDSTRGMELFLLLAALADHKNFVLLRRYLTVEDFEGAQERRIFQALDESIQAGESSLESVFLRLGDDALTQELTQRLLKDEYESNGEDIVKNGVQSIQLRNMQKKATLVQEKISQLEKSMGTWDQIQSLLEEKKYLDQEILRIKGAFHG